MYTRCEVPEIVDDHSDNSLHSVALHPEAYSYTLKALKSVKSLPS